MRGRLTVSCLCHSLSDESTRAATVLGSWANIPGIIRDNDLVAHIKDKKFWLVKEVESDIIVVD